MTRCFNFHLSSPGALILQAARRTQKLTLVSIRHETLAAARFSPGIKGGSKWLPLIERFSVAQQKSDRI
jgi:hypothetical protein